MSSSFCRHFFLSLSFFSRILTSHSVQCSSLHGDDCICIHTDTHTHWLYGSLGRLTRKVTPNYLSANRIEHLLVRYMYYIIFFYIFILFVLKIPPLRCARIILYHVLHPMRPYHYYIPILHITYNMNVYGLRLYTYNTTLYDVQFSCPQSRVYYARALPLYIIIIIYIFRYDVRCSVIRTNLQKCDTLHVKMKEKIKMIKYYRNKRVNTSKIVLCRPYIYNK